MVLEKSLNDQKAYKEIREYGNPIRVIELFKKYEGRTLMSEADLRFLCGAIREKRPQKIVEIGIADGGTTTIIAQCIKDLDLRCEFHSIDNGISSGERYPGYLFDKCKKELCLENIHHELHIGALAPEFIDGIGRDIDFLVLDTLHGLPGELLEFITVLPYLKDGCMVVVHDIALHVFFDAGIGFEYATQLLFNVVVADKFLNKDETRPLKFPNIAGFCVTPETRCNIINCFGAMNMTWSYLPDDAMYNKYLISIKKNYPIEFYEMLVTAKELNKIHFMKRMQRNKKLFLILNRNVYIYGAGERGKAAKKIFDAHNIEIQGFVVSDDQEISVKDTYHLSERIDYKSLYVIAVSDKLKPVFRENLQKAGVKNFIEDTELRTLFCLAPWYDDL